DVNWLTIKYSLNGAVEWQRTLSGAAGADDRPSDLRLGADGGLVVLGGTSNIGVALAHDLTVAKYDPAGALLWARTITDTAASDEVPGGLALDAAGNIYATGVAGATISAESASVPFTLKLDAAGNPLFLIRGDSAGGTSAALAPDGSLVVCGTAI